MTLFENNLNHRTAHVLYSIMSIYVMQCNPVELARY